MLLDAAVPEIADVLVFVRGRDAALAKAVEWRLAAKFGDDIWI